MQGETLHAYAHPRMRFHVLMETTFFTFTPTVAERDEAGLPRRFEGVAYSGGVIPGYGWHGDAAIDLSTMELPQGQVFALVDHDPGKRAGKLSARLVGNQVLVSGEFFTASDAGKEVAALFAEGAPWQMSVGIQGKVENGDRRSVELNGRALSVDTIFRNAKLREVSFVPVGADPNTSVAAFARRHTDHQPEEPTMADLDQFKARIVELEAQLGAKDAEASNTAAELAALRQFKADSRKRDIERLQDDLALELSADKVTEFAAMTLLDARMTATGGSTCKTGSTCDDAACARRLWGHPAQNHRYCDDSSRRWPARCSATRSGLTSSIDSKRPAPKPPAWAQNATPAPPSPSSPLASWIRNQ